MLAIPTGKRPPFHVRLQIAPVAHFPSETETIRQLLRTHALKVDGMTTVDGRQAIKLSSVAGRFRPESPDSGLEYYVDPGKYHPIREVINRAPYLQVSQTWTGYQVLSTTTNNQRLLSLTARHPNAHIDRNHADYLPALRAAAG